ncbi:MAG: hypothetical protein IJR50_09385 [Treponema sp.]|nr:hypothetical protein [Treponema sp.]
MITVSNSNQLSLRSVEITKFKIAAYTTVLIIFSFTLFACSKNETHITIWTDRAEFVPYVELFNSMHRAQKVLLVYKSNPSQTILSANEPMPDLVIGSWLCTDKMNHVFRPLDTVFDRKGISPALFYPQLLNSGKMRRTQYLLPVSFNLPAVIFAKENAEHVEEDYILSLEQLRAAGKSFNMQQANGVYTRIGFAPLANDDFLYFAAKAKGAEFRETKTSFTWNSKELSNAVLYLQHWTKDANTSANAERDFIYKYLFMAAHRQVASNRTLFAYTTSDAFFRLPEEQLNALEYRWISENKKIPVEDSFVMLGIPRRSKHPNAAYDFIDWFFNVETQRNILDYTAAQNLGVDEFGIAGGFSAIREVNEQILPLYKTALLSNTPPATMLSVPNYLPSRWNDMKKQIVIPYLQQEAGADDSSQTIGLSERINDWIKRHYN